MNMRKTRRHNRNSMHTFGRACAMSVAISILSSCIYDGETPECALQYTGEEYTLNLALSAGPLASRAADLPEGTDEECFIRVFDSDYAIFILDETGKLIQRFEPESVTVKPDGTNNYIYLLNGAFKPERDLSKMQLMVLANWRTGFGGNYVSFENEIAENSLSLSVLYSADDRFLFTIPAGRNSDASWTPKEGESGIPMFGISKLINLNNSDTRIDLDPDAIPVLRALAKIEIVDMVPEGRANIERCVLTKYNKNGRFIPDGSEWTDATDGGWDIEKINNEGSPSLPVSVETDKNLPFSKSTRTVTIGDEKVEKDYFVVYVPEMELSSTDRPELKVYLEGNNNPYTIYLSDYENGKPKENSEYETLLRNHSYRYNVTSVGLDTDLWLWIETPYWDPDEDEYWYEDTQAVYASNGTFAWQWAEKNKDSEEFVPDGEEKKRRTVIVSQEGGIEAIATFTLEEPARGTWTLSLSTDETVPKHWFRIDLWDEKTGDWIIEDQFPDADNVIAAMLSGNIAKKGDTPETVKIRIVAQGLQTSGAPYIARLLMNVTTFDGRMTEVNLTNDDPMMQPIEHYIIKQNPTSEL